MFADRDAREFAHRAIEEPRRSLRRCPALGSSMFQGEFGELQSWNFMQYPIVPK